MRSLPFIHEDTEIPLGQVLGVLFLILGVVLELTHPYFLTLPPSYSMLRGWPQNRKN